MSNRNFPAMNIGATGATVTTTISTSANGTIPNTSAGTKARYVRVASTVYVRLTVGAGTAVTTDAMVTSGSPLILETLGYSHYAVIDDGASVKVNIAPLEDN
jgi:hypothetical protein